MSGPHEASKAYEHYRRILSRPWSRGTTTEGLDEDQLDLSASANADRVRYAASELNRIVKTQFGDDPQLHQLAGQITSEAGSALQVLSDQDMEKLARPESMAALEVIVRTDGSRPSFLIRNGKVDFASSPAGEWTDVLGPVAETVQKAVSCVGRIDHPAASQGFQGTGFLIGPDVILTNRHVLQVIGAPDENKVWKLDAGVAIDFGHEFRGRASVNRRALRSVLFCGKDPILPTAIDHTRLDLVLIELEPVAAGSEAPDTLAFDISPDWAIPALTVFTIGYPANPGFTEQLNLLEQLFQSTFGFKRLAPGTITKPGVPSPPEWMLAHDCTTLGGNSGSVVLVASRGSIACGLHYGGRRADPRENWGHILGLTLDTPNAAHQQAGDDPLSLRELLKKHGVQLIDPHAADL